MVLPGRMKPASRFRIDRKSQRDTASRVRRAFLAGGWFLAVGVLSADPALPADIPEETEEISVRGAGYEEYISVGRTSAGVRIHDVLVIGMNRRPQRQVFAAPEAHILRRLSKAKQAASPSRRSRTVRRGYGSGIRYASGIRYGSGIRRLPPKHYGAGIHYAEGIRYGSGFRRPSIRYGEHLHYRPGYGYGSQIRYGGKIRYAEGIRYGR